MGPLPRGYIPLSKHLSGKMVAHADRTITLPGYSYPMHSARTASNPKAWQKRTTNVVRRNACVVMSLSKQSPLPIYQQLKYITLKTDVFKGIFSHHHTFLQYTIHSVIYKTSHLKDTQIIQITLSQDRTVRQGNNKVSTHCSLL